MEPEKGEGLESDCSLTGRRHPSMKGCLAVLSNPLLVKYVISPWISSTSTSNLLSFPDKLVTVPFKFKLLFAYSGPKHLVCVTALLWLDKSRAGSLL